MAGAAAGERENDLVSSRLKDFFRHREPVIEMNLNDPASLPFFKHLFGPEPVECLFRCLPAGPEAER
ncbi:hypothetical protein [Methylorubrum aminovorans]